MNEEQMKRIKSLTVDDQNIIEQCISERNRLKKQVSELSNHKLAIKFNCETWQVKRIGKYGVQREA